MLADETCFFLAVDLDGEGWREDALALVDAVRDRNLPFALERSRSGNGAHLWLFFEEAIPATRARKLGAHLLTEAMEARPEVGLGSYDRLFPNQDTLPRGGFGNLIALPLQKQAREKGNTLFLDDALEPLPDPWAFLGQMEKIPHQRVEQIVAEAERRNRVLGVRIAPSEAFASEPWRASASRLPKEPPILEALPAAIELILGDQIYIPKTDLPPALRNRIVRLAAFQNPEFYRAQAMRLPTFDKPRVIACAEDYPEHLALPRGCMDDLRTLCRGLKVRVRVRDERVPGTPLDLRFAGELRPDQKTAFRALLKHDTGILAATTAFGKTVLAASLIAERGVNTLVLVHRRQLMEQWVERLTAFLNITKKDIGCLGGGRRKLKGRLDVALLQSVVRKQVVDDRVADYGHLIIDECHHLSATSFELVARRAKARFVLGLSATVERKDGHHPIIFMQCGPVRHRVDAKDHAKTRPFRHHVVVRPTAFRPETDPEEDARIEFQQLCSSLMRDDRRNQQILQDVGDALRRGRNPLVLTERTEHLSV
ncbi:MAG: DEAD/DEAH box helicase, partial [Puniceicoccaceae bacterium]